MKWIYRKIEDYHLPKHYLVCEDAGEIQEIIPNYPAAQYTYSNISEIVADGIRCSCDTKYSILERSGYCDFQPLRSDIEKVDFVDLAGIRDGTIFEVNPEKTYMIGSNFIYPISIDPRVLYILHRAHLEDIRHPEAVKAAFARIPTREEAQRYLRQIGANTEWNPY